MNQYIKNNKYITKKFDNNNRKKELNINNNPYKTNKIMIAVKDINNKYPFLSKSNKIDI